MLRLDSPPVKDFSGKVLEIGCHDKISPSLDRGSQHMTVILIRQGENVNQVLEVGDQGISGMCIHQVARSFQFLTREVCPSAEKSVYPFIMNGVRPLCPIEIGDRQLQ